MSFNENESSYNPELIELALNSTDLSTLKKLTNAKDVNVRRSLAKNKALTPELVEILVLDPVLNVSFIASKHHNCTFKRSFKPYNLEHKCIQCTVDEKNLDCQTCSSHQYIN